MQHITAVAGRGTYRTRVGQRVAELFDADRALKQVPGTTESPEFVAAYQRYLDARRSLPLWLRWMFA